MELRGEVVSLVEPEFHIVNEGHPVVVREMTWQIVAHCFGPRVTFETTLISVFFSPCRVFEMDLGSWLDAHWHDITYKISELIGAAKDLEILCSELKGGTACAVWTRVEIRS